MRDVETVGGKNASLGEMIRALGALGISVPGGFATTAHAYREFLAQGGLDARIRAELARLDVDDVARLAATGARIRQWILATPFPPALTAAVSAQLKRMSTGGDVAVAVRSSATAEDLPEASFAGQQESFLNVRGEAEVLKAMHEVFASLFNDRAISYRVHQGFDHAAVALSAGVQHMVRSDLGASGVDRKSTRLNSSHVSISYAVFCLEKKREDVHGVAGAERRPRPGHGCPTRQRLQPQRSDPGRLSRIAGVC